MAQLQFSGANSQVLKKLRSRFTPPDSVVESEYKTRGSKLNTKLNSQLLNARHRLEICFCLALKIFTWPLAHIMFQDFLMGRSKEDMEVPAPSPHPEHMCLKVCSNGTQNPSFGSRQWITIKATSALLFHWYIWTLLSKGKPSFPSYFIHVKFSLFPDTNCILTFYNCKSNLPGEGNQCLLPLCQVCSHLDCAVLLPAQCISQGLAKPQYWALCGAPDRLP